MIGDTLTEVPSLAFACLSLALLLARAIPSFCGCRLGRVHAGAGSQYPRRGFLHAAFPDHLLGRLVRGDRKFSWRRAIIFGLIFVAAFGAFNVLLPRLITEQSGATFGNFSWMLYGQAVGGAGFQYHLQALGTDDSAVVLQAALQKIREYPLGLMIGFYKSYRDFFTHNSLGMFDLLSGGKAGWGWFFWSLCIAGLINGLARALPDQGKRERYAAGVFHRHSGLHSIPAACRRWEPFLFRQCAFSVRPDGEPSARVEIKP
jgi:hypothetical protein